ncbi:MAG: hypothetical protein IJK06_08275, partial [Clostridia bacterium]|nr:hypothetical protein [Clostridia bacterium]
LWNYSDSGGTSLRKSLPDLNYPACPSMRWSVCFTLLSGGPLVNCFKLIPPPIAIKKKTNQFRGNEKFWQRYPNTT